MEYNPRIQTTDAIVDTDDCQSLQTGQKQSLCYSELETKKFVKSEGVLCP